MKARKATQKGERGATYCNYRVSSGNSEDVGARHCLLAHALDLRFDGVDDVEPSQRVGVGFCRFLSREARSVVQQNRAVASLPFDQTNSSV